MLGFFLDMLRIIGAFPFLISLFLFIFLVVVGCFLWVTSDHMSKEKGWVRQITAVILFLLSLIVFLVCIMILIFGIFQ